MNGDGGDIITRIIAEDDSSAVIDAAKANFQQYIDEVIAGTPAEEAFAAATARANEAMAAQAGAAKGAAAAEEENTAAVVENTVAADANTQVYLRGHAGLLSFGEAVGPVAIAVVALGAAMAATAISASDWQEKMVLLQNNTGASDATIATMSQGILQLSAAIGANSTNMADGARRILDYGFAGQGAMNILTESSKLAVATGANEADIAQAVAQALHQYGAGADEASKYLGILYESSLKANSTVQDFSENIKKVTGLASEVGVPFTQATAAVAALTREMANVPGSATQVYNIMTRILHPTKAAADAWDDLSKKSGDLAISSANLQQTLSDEGLTGVINHVKAAMDKLGYSHVAVGQATLDLMNAQRGGIGMFELLSNANTDYNTILAANTDTSKTNADMQDGLARQLDTADNAWKRVGDTIHSATAEGTAFADASKNMANGLAGLMTGTVDTTNANDAFTFSIDALINTFGPGIAASHDMAAKLDAQKASTDTAKAATDNLIGSLITAASAAYAAGAAAIADGNDAASAVAGVNALTDAEIKLAEATGMANALRTDNQNPDESRYGPGQLGGAIGGYSSQPDYAAAQAAITKAAAKAAGGGGGASPAQAASTLAQDQQKYQLALEQLKLDEAMKTASDNLKDATDAKKLADQQYDNVLQQLADDERKLTIAEANDPKLNSAKANASVTEQFAAQSAANDAADANKLTVAIHQTSDQLAELAREEKAALDPLKLDLQNATDAMTQLNQETAATDHQFQDTLNTLSNAQYDLAKQTEDAMEPLQAALDAANLKMQAAQQRVTDLSNAEANQLFPIEQKLTLIKQQQADANMADKLEQEGQGVANLTARLNDHNLSAAERAVLQEQLAKAQRDMGYDQQTKSLTDQENGIKDKYAVELQAAKLQEEAAAKQQQAAQKTFDQESKMWAKKKEALDEEAQTVQHQQALYDQQQNDKKFAEQTTIDGLNNQIIKVQELATARAKSDTDYLTELQSEQGEQAFTAGQDAYNWGLAVTAAKNAVNDLEAPYRIEQDRLKLLADGVKDEKHAYDESTQPIINHLGDIKDAIQGVIDTFTNNKKLLDFSQTWADAQTKASNAIDKTKDGAPIVGDALSIIATAQQGMASITDTLTTSLTGDTSGSGTGGLVGGLKNTATALGPSGLGQAVSDFSTNIATPLSTASQSFNKYFGLPSSAGYDQTVNIGWLMDHKNQKGFWGSMIESADLALGVDGLRGMFDTRLSQLQTDVNGVFVNWEGTLKQEGIDDATAYANGFFDTLNSRFGTGSGGGQQKQSSNPNTPPLGSDSIGSFSVNASQLGGAQVHNSSIGAVNIHLPNGMTSLPKTASEWVPYIKNIETATKWYDKFG